MLLVGSWVPVQEQGQPAPHPDQAAGAAQQQPVLFWGVRLFFPLFPSLRWKLLTALQLVSPDVCCFGWGKCWYKRHWLIPFLPPCRGSGTRSKEVPTALCSSSVRAWSGLACSPLFAVATMMTRVGLQQGRAAPGSAQTLLGARMCQTLSGQNLCFPAPEPALPTALH